MVIMWLILGEILHCSPSSHWDVVALELEQNVKTTLFVIPFSVCGTDFVAQHAQILASVFWVFYTVWALCMTFGTLLYSQADTYTQACVWLF